MDANPTFLRFLIVLLLTGNGFFAFGQGSILYLGSPEYEILERTEILSGRAPVSDGVYPMDRGSVVQFMLDAEALDSMPTKVDGYNSQKVFTNNNEWLACDSEQLVFGKSQPLYEQVLRDSNLYRKVEQTSVAEASVACPQHKKCKKPFLNTFYKTPGFMFEAQNSFFYARANPVINVFMGNPSGRQEGLVFNNLRGVNIRGGIDDRVYFSLEVYDNQSKYLTYVDSFVTQNRAIPGNGFYKTTESRIFNAKNVYDFSNGQGQIGLRLTNHLGLQFGHGRNFIGDGYRSMLLSDFGQNYLYLKLNWNIWKFHYQNLFTELAPTSSASNVGNVLLPKKYMAAHYLGFKHKGFSAGFFEATVFHRDSENGRFEFQYLNPIILYRTVEHLIDSPDNILIGLNVRQNFLKRFQAYGQLLMDEFKFNKLFVERKGWWGNKFGVQLGLKYKNAFSIKNLDLQAEMNLARPYTYSHRDSLGDSYSHYNLPLAHPLGSNFNESVFRLRYQPLPKLLIESRIISASKGIDPIGENWGGNILLPNTTREMENGNEIGQGNEIKTMILGADVSYELLENLHLSLHYFSRDMDGKNAALARKDSYIGIGIRLNSGILRMDY